MVNDSDWIRVAHNSFARRLDLLNAALALQNEADNKKKRARSTKQKKRKPKRDRARSDKNSSSAYHFIAFVPVGQRVWQLDGLTSTPVCIGEYEEGQHWTSVMRPVLQERMMRYETERLSFSLLALCGDNLDPRRKKLAINVRHLADLEARFSNSPEWHSKPANPNLIYTPTDGRLSAYQLDADNIQAVPEPQAPCDATAETALTLWAELSGEQQRLCAQYLAGLQMGGQEPTAILGRTKDYTAAVHEWVKKLTDRGALRRLHEDVQLQSGL